jgi:hypothetical protein
MDTEDYFDEPLSEGLPAGLNVLCRCKRTETDSILVLKVPTNVSPNGFPDWCMDYVPLGFHPMGIVMATDEQCEAMEY